MILTFSTPNSKISVFLGLHEVARNVISRKTRFDFHSSSLLLFQKRRPCPQVLPRSTSPFPVGLRDWEEPRTPNKHTNQASLAPARLLVVPSISPAEFAMLINAYDFLLLPCVCICLLSFNFWRRQGMQHLMIKSQKFPCVLIFCQIFVVTNFCGHLYFSKKTGNVGSKIIL